MFNRVKERLGTAGLIVAVVALIVALSGGAYAASNSGGGKATVSNGKRGKQGKRGPAGPQGPQGLVGPKGDAGAAGLNGGPGADGKSVVNTTEPKGANCAEGGTKLAGSSTTYACNGLEGEAGEEGSPWTAGGVLPPTATETGTWAFNASDVNTTIYAPISFTIPVGLDLFVAEGFAHFQTDVNFTDFCKGNALEPSAPVGELCVYSSSLSHAELAGIGNGASKFSFSPGPTGAMVRFTFTGGGGEEASGFGSWAVTGCSLSLPEGDPGRCPSL